MDSANAIAMTVLIRPMPGAAQKFIDAVYFTIA